MPLPGVEPAAPCRILIVDADDRVRESLMGLLGIGPDLLVVGSAGDAETAIALVASTAPDCLVIDPRLPGIESGLDLIRRVHQTAPGVRIVAMGWADAPEPRAVDAGLDGWVRKTFRPTELNAAIVAATARRPAPQQGMVL